MTTRSAASPQIVWTSSSAKLVSARVASFHFTRTAVAKLSKAHAQVVAARIPPSSPRSPRARSGPSSTSSPTPCDPVPRGRRPAPGRQDRPHRLRGLPGRALAQDLVDQSPGTVGQGGQTPHRCGRHLPQHRRPAPGSRPASSSKPTTNGKTPTAATSPKRPWPYSTHPHRPCCQPPRLPLDTLSTPPAHPRYELTSTQSSAASYTTLRDVTGRRVKRL